MDNSVGAIVVALLALCLVLAAIARIIFRRAGGKVGVTSRVTRAVLLGAASIALGACLRAGADSWSRGLVHRPSPGVTIARQFDPDRYEFFREAGAWSIGFGVAVLAVTVGVWVSREPPPPPSTPGTEADGTPGPAAHE